MMYWKYLKYLIRHKWFVSVECFRHGLIWRGLMHDLSKFRPSEFFPYARYFYGEKKESPGRNCYKCFHITGNQCGVNGSGIGDGEQAEHCRDYEHSGIRTGRDSTGYYSPGVSPDYRFNFAWLLHQKRNDHHWQWWWLKKDDGGQVQFPMSKSALMEMICDWVGAGRAITGKKSPKDDPYKETRNWYLKNKGKILIHERTRELVEKILSIQRTVQEGA